MYMYVYIYIYIYSTVTSSGTDASYAAQTCASPHGRTWHTPSWWQSLATGQMQAPLGANSIAELAKKKWFPSHPHNPECVKGDTLSS